MENKEKKAFSVKEFFKSTAFKCIAVLLAIALVCGILLTFCNSLFAISPEEKLNRALSKIYPDGKVEEIICNEDNETDKTTTFDNGKIEAAYKMDDGNYLISSVGNGGYGGTVTCWVVIEMADNKIDGIGTVAIGKAPGETFLSRITADDLKYFSENYTDGEEFVATDYSDNTAGTGATAPFTRNGITNSVNTAVEFVRSQLLGEVTEPDPFEGFSYTDYIDTKNENTTVALAEDGTSVIFHITTTNIVTDASTIDVTVNSEGTITDYTVTFDGTTDGEWKEDTIAEILDGTMFENKKAADLLPLLGTEGENGFTPGTSDNSLHTGATYTNFYYVYAAVFAASNYENGYVMALENSLQYTQYIDMENTTVKVNGTDVVYHITTTNIVTDASTIDVTVNSEGTITDYTVTFDGTTDGEWKEDTIAEILDGTMFENKKAADLLPLLGTKGENGFTPGTSDDSLHTGATYTNFYYVYAAVFAASNYDTYAKLVPVQLNIQMSEIYGESISVEAVSLDGFTTTVENGTVNTVYKVVGTDNYIVNATGTGGFSNGTVTAWIVVKTAGGAVTEIGNMIIESNVGQSYMDRLDQNDLDYFKGVSVNGDFTVEGWQNDTLHGGATIEYTMTAIVNSVNAAKNFVTANLLTEGGENA